MTQIERVVAKLISDHVTLDPYELQDLARKIVDALERFVEEE